MKSCNVFAVLVTLILFPCWMRGTYLRQTIKNTTKGQVNDAVIQFDGHITTVKMGGATGVINKGVTQDTGEFAQKTFGTLDMGDTIDVDFSPTGLAGSATAIVANSGHWTFDGANKGAITTVAGPMQVNGSLSLVEFFNPGAVAIVYSGISVWVNNNLTDYSIDQAFTPTGMLVSGLPNTITLNPGQTFEFSFGPAAALGYDLVLANVAVASDPTDLFGVGNATLAVPEPAPWFLVAAALFGIAICKTKNPQSVHSSAAPPPITKDLNQPPARPTSGTWFDISNCAI